MNSIVLLGIACDYIKEHKDKESNKEKTSSQHSNPSSSPMRDFATSPTKPTVMHKRQSSDNTVIITRTSLTDSGDDVAGGVALGASESDSTHRMKRSQSVGGKVTFQDIEMIVAGGVGSESSNAVDTPGMGIMINRGSGEEVMLMKDDDDDDDSLSALATPGALTPRALMSNSTVSLESMCLNEDFIKDKGEDSETERDKKRRKEDLDDEKGARGGGELRQRKSSESVAGAAQDKSKDRPDEKLKDVDRFSMCSNRII